MKRKTYVALLAPAPALCLGAIAMRQSGISPVLYWQNIICYLLLGLVVLFLSPRTKNVLNSRPTVLAFLALCGVMLAATFLDKGLENVHRWLAIGNFRLYIASLVLSSAVIGIGVLLKEKDNIPAITMAAILSVCLVLQPDASQLTAFSLAIAFLVWESSENRALTLCVALPCAALIIYSLIHIDTLAPIPHVENILFLVFDMGVVWFVLGVVSLILLILPFITLFQGVAVAKAIGLYYSAIIVTTFFGNFPVPFMGQGISPIIGYLLAVFLLAQEKGETQRKSKEHNS